MSTREGCIVSSLAKVHNASHICNRTQSSLAISNANGLFIDDVFLNPLGIECVSKPGSC